MQKENSGIHGLDHLSDILDTMKKTLPKGKFNDDTDEEETYSMFNREIDQFHNSVDNKVSELFNNIINNFNKTSLNTLNSLNEKPKKSHNFRSSKYLKERAKKQGKQNIFELVSKKMILTEQSNNDLDKEKSISILPKTFEKLDSKNNENNDSLNNLISDNKIFGNTAKAEISLVAKYRNQSSILQIQRFPPSTKHKSNIITTRFQIVNYRFLDSIQEIANICKFSQQQILDLKGIVKNIQSLCKSYKIDEAIISSNKLRQLLEVKLFPKQIDFIDLFENKSDLHKTCKAKYWGEHGKTLGIIKVQSIARMFIQKQKYKKLQLKYISALKIQQYWRGKGRLDQTRKLIKARNIETLKTFNQIQERFKSNWGAIKFQNRVQIHIASWESDQLKRLSTEKLRQKQNTEITRIFRVKDPFVTVIYISPLPITSQIVAYYKKVLTLTEQSEQSQKVYFISPQVQLTNHETLITSVMSSPKCLQRMRNLIGSKIAYIVPGQPSMQYIKLSTKLSIPIYGCLDSARYLSFKSAASEVSGTKSIPCLSNIFQLNDLFLSFSNLIYSHPEVQKWYFKIDDQKKGRGNAYVETKSFHEFTKLQDRRFDEYSETIINYISIILQDKLKNRLKIVYPDLFRSYEEYMRMFLTKGGSIQASIPTFKDDLPLNVSTMVQIYPDNNWKILSTYEKIVVHSKPIGYEFIQMNKGPDSAIVERIVNKLIKKYQFFGYISFDFLRIKEEPKFQLIGMDPYLNQAAAAYFMGSYFTNLSNPLFVYCPLIVQNEIKSLQFKTFFQICRLQGISFDVTTHSGSIFIIVDSLQSSCLSLICISQSKREMYKYMMDTMQFLSKKSQKRQTKFNYVNSYDGIGLEQISHKIRVIYKKLEPKRMSCSKPLISIK